MKNEPSTFIISIPGSVGTPTHTELRGRTYTNKYFGCVCERAWTHNEIYSPSWENFVMRVVVLARRARAASTMVIASNSTSRRGIRVLISLAHSTLSKAGDARGSSLLLLKNPRSQKGLIKKNYWELSFWQKHGKGVTSALLFLLFQTRGACSICVVYTVGVRRASRARIHHHQI